MLLNMKKIIILVFICFVLSTQSIFALDWQNLHRVADAMTLKQAQSAVIEKPESISGQYILGLVYLNLRKNKEAADVFSKIINSSKDTFEAKWGLAEVDRRFHELERAQESLLAIINAHPDFAPALISLAYIKYIEMDFNEAVRLASYVVAIGQEGVDLSNYVRAMLLVGGAKGMIAHYGGPISKLINGTAVFPSLKRAEKLQPDSSGVLFGLGSFYLLAPSAVGGDIEKAFFYLEKASKIDPGFSDCFVRLAQIYKVRGDKDKYETNMAKALELDPKNEIALDIKNGICKFICVGK